MKIWRAGAIGAAFGAFAGLVESHAYAASTQRFDLASSLFFSLYLGAAFALAGGVLGLAAALRGEGAHGSRAALVAGGLLGLLAVARAVVDGDAIRIAASAPARIAVAGGFAVALAALGLAVPVLERRRPPTPARRALAIGLGAAACVYAAFGARGALAATEVGDAARLAAVLLCAALAAGLAYAGGLRAAPRSGALVLVALVALPLLAGWAAGPPFLARVRLDAESAPPPAAAKGPNVVMIVLDTLRADHLAPYGYERDTMPRLSRFAAEALLFEHCTSSSNWSLPSHATLFTGLQPREHGATHGAASLGEAAPPRELPDEAVTLAEILRSRGYRTIGISANYGYVSERFGLHQGFEHWDTRAAYRGASAEGFRPLLFRTLPLVDKFWFRWIYEPLVRFDVAQVHYRRADAISDESIRLLAGPAGDGERPFFLFVNYMEPHDPYRAPPAFVDHFPGRLRDRPREFSRGRGFGDLAPEALRAHFASLYDSELAFLDRELDRLLGFLDSRDLLADSIVVVTSDHGEQFGEHGKVGHSKSLHEEEVHVPLLIRDPARSPGRVAHPVELRDLFPWLLERLALPLPPGVAASDLFSGATPNFAEFFSSPRGDETAVRDGRWKYLRASDAADALFDLATDPGERRDLAAERPERAAALAGIYEAWSREHPVRSGRAKRLDPAEIEMLRDLGYVE